MDVVFITFTNDQSQSTCFFAGIKGGKAMVGNFFNFGGFQPQQFLKNFLDFFGILALDFL